MNRTVLLRKTINAPSTLQSLHKYHGKRVLVAENDMKDDDKFVTGFFTEGDVVSMMMEKLLLSDGFWEIK